MERREQYKRLIMFLSSAVIMAIQVALFARVWYEEYNSPEIIQLIYWNRGNWAVIGLYAIILYFFYKLYGVFKVGYLRILDIFSSQVLSIICVNSIAYLQLALIGRWRWLSHIRPMIYLTFLDIIVSFIWILFVRWIYARIYPPREMLLVYGNINPDDLIDKISTRKDKYIICEIVHVDKGIDYIKDKMKGYKSVLLGDIPAKYRNVFLKYCFENSIRCYSIPKISDILIRSADEINLFDSPLMLSRNRGLTIEQKFTKRLLDLSIGILGTVIASPFMIIIAIIIKLYDRGPIFYTQDRLTLDGREFKVYKFRSMIMDSEKDGARLAMKNDSRITPIGKIIRNLHFDELPQLFNILKGDMSVVGPRPERKVITEEYEKDIPEFKYRLKVKAGLTGYAQVYGKYNTTPYDKLKLDLTYIERYTILLDLKIILLTFKILFQKENTEGVEQWQTTARKDKE